MVQPLGQASAALDLAQRLARGDAQVLSQHALLLPERAVPQRRVEVLRPIRLGQASEIADQYVNSTLPHSQRLDEPEDSLGFGGASIPPDGEATFRFIVSDMSPIYRFYLVQRPQQPLS